MYDLIIRGATVIDGLGNEPVRVDVAVSSGRIAAIGDVGKDATTIVDAGGLTLTPGIVDLHTHYDAQATWDSTLSPSPSLGVTTAVIGNCGFGIAPSPPSVRDLVIRNLSVVEGMDLDALRTGIDWNFVSFKEYMAALRARGLYANVGVLFGHSIVRTAVMGPDASERRKPTKEEMQRMQALVADGLLQGAIGFATSFSPNHSGYGGVPMPSTIAEPEEFDALVGAMGARGRGVVSVASGAHPVEEMEGLAARHGHRFFLAAAMSMFDETQPQASASFYDRCRQAQQRGTGVYVQSTCQPISFDFTLENAYPLHGHAAYMPIKALVGEELKRAVSDPAFRAEMKANLRNPKPGLVFRGTWSRVIVAAVALEKNAKLVNRSVADIAAERGVDPVDLFFDLCVEENLQTSFVAKLLNAVDDGVAPLLKHEASVIALSDAGAHLIYFCDAGFGLHFLSHWVRERGDFGLVEGVRRLTSHPASLYGMIDRGRIQTGAFADLMLFDPKTVGLKPAYRVPDLPGGGKRTLRQPTGIEGVFVNGVKVYDGDGYVNLERGPGHVLDRFEQTEGPLAR
jgi:N-acyl-D-aspartate/D-glutamate deacylase